MDIKTQVETFVTDFMKKYSSLIGSVGRRYLIPNRYTVEDIKQYVAERIIQILTNRLSTPENQIEDPEKYFKSCISYYCIEYQRMHGYIFDLPKRPRKNHEEDETYARSFGFKYLGDITIAEYNSLTTEDEEYEEPENLVWNTIMAILSKEEAAVLDCIFRKNMTWLETSKHLTVPQSTCWIRKDRAITKIYKQFDALDGDTNGQLKRFLRGDTEVLGDFIDN